MVQTRNAKGQFEKNGKAPVRKKAKATAQSNGSTVWNRQDVLDYVQNVAFSRSRLFKEFRDPRRDINDECGLPETVTLTPHWYKTAYERQPIAARVVEVLPKESWQATPSIFEDDDPNTETKFEGAWAELSNELRGESWHASEEGNLLWEYLSRVDILSGIGSYGVLLLGINDNKELFEPVEPSDKNELLFLRVFDEAVAPISSFEADPANPRFGMPNIYSLTFEDPNNRNEGSAGDPQIVRQVHWTRIIHVADNLGSSEIFGAPRQRPVVNNLQNLDKLYNGSAEMYWRGAFPGLSFETHPQMGGDVPIDKDAMRDMVEQYMNGLQRYLSTSGMSVNSIAPQVVDPTPQINTQIEAICIEKAIPKRIFTGSERGELSSSMDMVTWHKRLGARQSLYLTPKIIVPFVDRLIILKILPQPKTYNVVWPDLNMLTESEQATVAVQRTEAMMKYVAGSVGNIMHPLDFFTRILGMTEDEAQATIDNVMVLDDLGHRLLDEPEPDTTTMSQTPKPKQ